MWPAREVAVESLSALKKREVLLSLCQCPQRDSRCPMMSFDDRRQVLRYKRNTDSKLVSYVFFRLVPPLSQAILSRD